MKLSVLVFLFIQSYFVNASYYTDGKSKINVDDVINQITKYDKTFIYDGNRPYSQREIERNGLIWECINYKGDLCSDCIPMGDKLCMGNKDSTTYNALYGTNPNSECVCALMHSEPIPTYVLYTKDGSDHYWDSLELVSTPDKHEYPPIMSDEAYNCTILPEEYLREKCFVEQIENYKIINSEKLFNITMELVDMDPELWHVNIDRVYGRITIYYDKLNEITSFSNKLEYKLELTDVFYLSNYSHDNEMVFDIPNESFWRNISLTWSVFTTEQWLYGSFLIKQDTLRWYPNPRLENFYTVDECTAKCGAFCYSNFHCMTDKQKNIKMAGIVAFVLNLWVAGAFAIYVWWDQRKKIKSKGTNSKFVKAMLCITVVSLVIPSTNAWGTCTATSFTQSKLKVHKNGIDSIVWSGNMYLANLNGQSCFDIASPEDPEDIIIKAILEVEKAELVYTLTPQYSTFKFNARPHKADKCPIFVCATIDCDGVCDNDRTCDGSIPIDTSFIGRSECNHDIPVSMNCHAYYALFSCPRKRRVIGYQLEPIDWFIVSKLDENPSIRVSVKVTLDYLNGTKQIDRHVIDTDKPNTITPAFTVGDTEFYNNGISQTSVNPARDYVMIHVENTQHKQYPVTTDVAYLVNADPVGTKVKGKIGAVQCRVNERDNCDAPDDICVIDFSDSDHEVKCGIDPIETARNAKDTTLPLEINGISYKLSEDLTTVTAQLSNIGSIDLFMNGNSELQSETVNVVPECSLVGVANGCFMCTTGFWFKVKAKSTVDSGKAIVSISHSDTSNTKELGIFNKIVTLTTTDQEIDIHGFTQAEDNDLIVRISAGDNHCEFPLSFKAHFDDKTAIANRTTVFVVHEEDSNGLDIDLGDTLDDIGDFFSDFFDGIFSGPFAWITWVVTVVIILMLVMCCLGPCLGPFLSGTIEGGTAICKGCCKGTVGGYKLLKS